MKSKRKELLFVMLSFMLFIAGEIIRPDISGVHHSPVAVDQPQKDYVVSSSYSIQIESDSDDDWYINTGGGWTHRTGDTVLEIRNTTGPPTYQYYAQFRLPLEISSGVEIVSAIFNVYTVVDAYRESVTLRRINETNVGSLEGDSIRPVWDYGSTSTLDFDGASVGWSSAIVTDLIQEQIDLPSWESGYYIGIIMQFQVQTTSDWQIRSHDFGDGSFAAYLNVSYTTPVDIGGGSWLPGWTYRRYHILNTKDGAGSDYTVPLYVYYGQGDAYNDSVYLNGKSLSDFGDVRFTDSDGSTLLDYNLNATYESWVRSSFTDDSIDNSQYTRNWPAAWYNNGRTYQVYHGPNKDDPSNSAGDPYIVYYDHLTGEWSGPVWVGPNELDYDTHGTPCMYIDRDGFIHVFFGAHGNTPGGHLQHYRSNLSESITSGWVEMPELEDVELSYPHLSYDAANDVLHLFYRNEHGGAGSSISYRNSTDNGLTWSKSVILIDDTYTSGYLYPDGAGGLDPYQDDIVHFVWEYFPSAGIEHDVYYAYLNTTSMHVFNANGYDFGTKIDFQVDSDNLLVYDSPVGDWTWGASVRIDSNSRPYIMWTQENEDSDMVSMFTYWNGAGWNPVQTIAVAGAVVACNDFIIHSPTNITAFVSDGEDTVVRYSWDGSDWTYEEDVYQGSRRIAFALVPSPYCSEPHPDAQVTFTEYLDYGAFDCQAWVWGQHGILEYKSPLYAKFYVKIPGDLSENNQVIYLYYGNNDSTTESQSLDWKTGYDPDHGKWSLEEQFDRVGDAPRNIQSPTSSNLDNGDTLYAAFKEYQITVQVSDNDGYQNIKYVELSCYSNNRLRRYWAVRYIEDTNTFVEQLDPSNNIILNDLVSTNSSSGDTIDITFYVEILWTHPDLSNIDMRSYVVDNDSNSDSDWYELNWNIETRLELSGGPALTDNTGTHDRGDINGDILASGSVVYYGSDLHPPASEVDVYVVSQDVPAGSWQAIDYEETSGTFSVNVNADNEAGLDVYSFKVVPKDVGVGGSDLLDHTYTCNYIADSIVADILEDKSNSNETTVCFLISLTYAYDGAQITDFSLVINKNGADWLALNTNSFTDERDTLNDNTYSIGSASEFVYGLTTVQKLHSPFVLSSYNNTPRSPNTVDPEVVLDSFRTLKSVVDGTVTFLGTFALLIYNSLESGLNSFIPMLAPLYTDFSFALISVFSISILLLLRSRKNTRVRAVRRREQVLKSRDGLKVYSLLPIKGAKGDLKMVVRGNEVSYLILDGESKVLAEHLRFRLAAGERPTRLLRLFSSSIKGLEGDLSLLGLVWET